MRCLGPHQATLAKRRSSGAVAVQLAYVVIFNRPQVARSVTRAVVLASPGKYLFEADAAPDRFCTGLHGEGDLGVRLRTPHRPALFGRPVAVAYCENDSRQ